MPTNVRDPRSIVTPDAFEVSPQMLGLPLARPARRLGAMLVDLAIIGILTALLTDVQLVLWGTVALILLYAALQPSRKGGVGTHAAMLLRVSLGCLGAAVLSIVLIVAAVVVLQDDESEGPVAISVGEGDVAERVVQALGSGGRVARAAEALQDAETEAEAERAAIEILERLPELGLSGEDRLDLLREMTPDGAPWRESAEAIYRRAWEADQAERASPGSTAATPSAGDSVAASPAGGSGREPVPVDSLALEDALAEYAALVAGGEAEARGPASERAALLRRRLLPAIGEDTLEALAEALEEERGEREELEEEVQRLAGEGSGFVPLLREVWDQLGSAIGLWSLYFTVLLTVWRGQTVGKRLFGLRVVRLDGEPLGWWSSFERVGGYAAGIATGLLGFAQVLWDANRQCVHDKIVGTVVVMAGAPPIPGSWVQARVGDRGSEVDAEPGEEA